jgi:hypothetical protein
MQEPKPPEDSEKDGAGPSCQEANPAAGADGRSQPNVAIEPPTIIDLVRTEGGELTVMLVHGGKGRIGTQITHNDRIYRALLPGAIPLNRVPLPYEQGKPYGSTQELFQSLSDFLQQYGSYCEAVARLLSYWVLASWFADCFAFSPCLVLTGAPLEADLLLLLLSYLCRLPFLLAATGPAAFASLPMEFTPTLLIREPESSKRMASLLRASSHRKYLTVGARGVRDLYCAKAIYLSEHGKAAMLGPHVIHLELASSPASALRSRRLPSWEEVLGLQNRLCRYRILHSSEVVNSDFDSAFSPELRAVAWVFGSCIVAAPELRADLVPLLTGQEQRLNERRNELETVVLEALLLQCHEERSKIFVRDITKAVNQIYKDKGERLEASAEEVGHKLKSLGLFTRRLGSAGRGLQLDQKTQAFVHERAYAQQLVSPDDIDEGCQHCQRLQLLPEEGVVSADGRS